VTDLLARLTRGAARRGDGDPSLAGPSLAVAAATAGVWAAAMGLVIVVIGVLLVWTTAAHSGSSVVDPVRGSAWLWLYAHFGALALPSGPLGLLPLGFTALPAALLWRAGAGLARTFAIRDRTSAAVATTALVASYAGLATLLAVLTAGGGVRAVPLRAFAGSALIALAAGGGAVVRTAGVGAAVTGRVGPAPAAVLAGAAAGLLTLAAGAALLAAGALALSLSDAADLHRALHPGLVGGVALFVAGVAAVPNALLWAAAYVVGPGFAVGTDTVVSPFAVSVGPVPAFPLLAALPDGAPPAPAAALVLAVPLAAAVVTGRLVGRRLGARDVRWVAGAAAVAGGTAGLLLGLAAGVAGGPLGAARLAAVGPSAWQVALAAGLELAVGAAGTVAAGHAWRVRRAA
jgi:hypothetical protein